MKQDVGEHAVSPRRAHILSLPLEILEELLSHFDILSVRVLLRQCYYEADRLT